LGYFSTAVLRAKSELIRTRSTTKTNSGRTEQTTHAYGMGMVGANKMIDPHPHRD
jgi:hypothetical protein